MKNGIENLTEVKTLDYRVTEFETDKFEEPEDLQGFHLSTLQRLATFYEDADSKIIRHFEPGFSVGIESPLPPSGIFPDRTKPQKQNFDFRDYGDNYSSAEECLDDVKRILDEDVKRGFFHPPIPKEKFEREAPHPVNYLPLGAVWEGKVDPRLVVDGTKGGINGKVWMSESPLTPSLWDLIKILRKIPDGWTAIKLDVSKAFRRLRVTEIESYILCLCINDQVYRPKTHPFGLISTGWWWARVGGLCHRIVQNTLPSTNAGLIYVDDSYWLVKKENQKLSLCIILLILESIGVKIHYGKVELGVDLAWVGYIVNLDTLTAGITPKKREKVAQKIKDFLPKKYIREKDLQSLLGALVWCSIVFCHSKPFLQNSFTQLRYVKRGVVKISKNMKRDLLLWYHLFTIRPWMAPLNLTPKANVTIYTDASTSGMGAWLDIGYGPNKAPWFSLQWDHPTVKWIKNQ